jgi:hypothetical protein
MEVTPLAPGQELDVNAISRRIVEQIAEATATAMAAVTAYFVALCVPGGILFDLAALVISAVRWHSQGQRAAKKIALQKREARIRLRNQRSDLVDRLGNRYRAVNQSICDAAIREATADAADHEQVYESLQARLRRLGQASADLSRLEADATGFVGGGRL